MLTTLILKTRSLSVTSFIIIFFFTDVFAAQLSTVQIVESVGPATAVVKASLVNGKISIGSGFVVTKSGTLVTNFHVVADAERIEVKFPSGDEYVVTGIRGVDKQKDIAVLQIPGFDLPIVELGNSNNVKVGQEIVVIGTSLGVLENTTTSGIISGIRQQEGYKWLQMDAAVSPGNSGGPVISKSGQVIGITTAKLNKGESLNFAVPINYAREFLTLPITQDLSVLGTEIARQKKIATNANVFLTTGTPGGIPLGQSRTQFNCKDKIFAVVEIAGLSHDVHKLEARWRGPNGVIQEYSELDFTGRSNKTKAWVWIKLHRAQQFNLAAIFNKSAGMKETIGVWEVDISVDGNLVEKKRFDVSC